MDLSRWMAEHPVIQTESEVKQATVLIDRAVLCIKDMEDERKAQTAPLREKVKEIDDSYRGPRELLERVTDELKSRWRIYVDKIEADRAAAADAAKMEASRLKAIAQQAEHREQDAIGSAKAGELGIDIAGIAAEADGSFADWLAAEREVTFLERAKKVKVKGIFKSRSLSNREIVEVADAAEVIKHIKLTIGLEAAIIKEAREYKKKAGNWPPGIKTRIERRL